MIMAAIKTKRTSIQIALLVFAVFALYLQSLHAPLFFDDPDLATLATKGFGLSNFELRWLSSGTLGWTIQLLGNDIVWLRLGNVLLHAANVIALFYFLKQLFSATLNHSRLASLSSRDIAWLAFFGALLFALHPVAVYGVGYLMQRSILMATLFMLLMLISYLHGLLKGGWLWMIVAAACYFAAVSSKEHSVTAPAVALALTFLVRKPSWALLKYVAPYYLLLAFSAVGIIYITSKMGLIANAYEPNGAVVFEGVEKMANQASGESSQNAYLLSILTQSTLFFKYLGLWLMPNPAWMSIDMREPIAVSLKGWHTLGLVSFVAYFCGAVWLLMKRGRRGLLGFALLFPWLLFLTEMATVRAQEPFVLYRSYFWMPGLFVALPLLLVKLSLKRVCLLLSVVAIVLVPLALNRLHSFSSGLLLWSDAEILVRNKHQVPGVERIYSIRAQEWISLGHYEEAITDLTTAIKVYPGYDFFYCDRATAEYLLGKYQEALSDYNRAISINAENPICYTGRARTHLTLGNNEAAQQDFAKSCALGICQ